MAHVGSSFSLGLVALVWTGCEANLESSVDPDAGADSAQVGPRDEAAVSVDAALSELLDAAAGDAEPMRDAMNDASPLDPAPEDGGDACVPAGGAPRLGAAVVMHACLHGSDGPFRVVTGGSNAESAPNVSRPHTLFTILTSTGDSVHVRYVPAASGDHVLFVARGELTAAEQASSLLALEPRAVDCAVLPQSYLMQVAGVEPVDLTLRAGSDRVAIVIESLAPWGEDSWQRACGAEPATASDAGACRTSGPCSSDDECCSYCHDYDHCH